jgi:hypothetical protein
MQFVSSIFAGRSGRGGSQTQFGPQLDAFLAGGKVFEHRRTSSERDILADPALQCDAVPPIAGHVYQEMAVGGVSMSGRRGNGQPLIKF